MERIISAKCVAKPVLLQLSQTGNRSFWKRPSTLRHGCVEMSRVEKELNGLVDEANSLENTYNRLIMVRWVNNGGLDRLPPHLNDVLTRHLKGDSIRQISKDMKLGRATIKERLEAVQKFIKDEVGRWLA